MEMGAYHYWCDFPVEENGSRWHCENGGGAVQGVGGINIFMFNASVIAPLGALELAFVPLPRRLAVGRAEPARRMEKRAHPEKMCSARSWANVEPKTGCRPRRAASWCNKSGNPQPSDHGKPLGAVDPLVELDHR